MNSQIRKLVQNSKKRIIIEVSDDNTLDDIRPLLKMFGLRTYVDLAMEDMGGYLITNFKMTVGDFIKYYTNTFNDDWAKDTLVDWDKNQELEKA